MALTADGHMTNTKVTRRQNLNTIMQSINNTVRRDEVACPPRDKSQRSVRAKRTKMSPEPSSRSLSMYLHLEYYPIAILTLLLRSMQASGNIPTPIRLYVGGAVLGAAFTISSTWCTFMF